MYEAIVITIIIASILLIGTILIQNPKGDGMNRSFGGLTPQTLGIKRTANFLEKGTWILAGAIASLSLITAFL